MRGAIEAGRNYALGILSWEAMGFAFVMADSITVPASKRKAHHWAMIAATSCAMTELYAGPHHLGNSPELAAIGAARIASCAARLAEQSAWGRSAEMVEDAQMALLRTFVPECFEEI